MEEIYKCSCCKETYVENKGDVCGCCEDFLYNQHNIKPIEEDVEYEFLDEEEGFSSW